MDSSGFVLLLIVAACVIALIYIAGKQKALDEEVVIKPTDSSGSSGTTSSTTGSTPSQPEEKPSGPPQNTIYEFNATSAKRLCTFCDGENSVGAKVCNICGRDL